MRNPLDLEVVADIISTDSVQVKVDSPVHIEGWGGPPLEGRVVRVAPSGFLKISLSVLKNSASESVTVDLVDPPEVWSSLGHDYCVTVRVVVWKGTDCLTVPVGALFGTMTIGRSSRSRMDVAYNASPARPPQQPGRGSHLRTLRW
jgi:HlyD family secretion protein